MQIQPPKNSTLKTSKTISFREEEARIFGIETAMVIHQIRYWTEPTRSKNYKEGRYWAYNSLRAWKEQFVSISERTLRRIFKRLETLGILVAKKFNAWRRDQRKWHTLDVEKLSELMQSLGIKSVPQPKTKSSNQVDLKILKAEPFIEENNPLPPEICGSSLEEKEESGRNLDVATLAASTCGQSGHMSKDTIITQKIISLPSAQQNEQTGSMTEMIKIWNQEVEKQSNKISLTFLRKKALKKALQEHFQSSIEKWKHYCLIIAHNTFLMGEGPNKWKATLDWALKAENIQKVQEKSYTGQKEILTTEKPLAFSKENVLGSEHWKDIAEVLVKHLGVSTFNAWFEKASLKHEMSECPVLSLGNNFKANWVRSRFSQIVESSIKAVLPHARRLSYEC